MQLNKTIWVLEDDPSQKFVFEEILGMRYETKFFDSLQSFSEQMDHLPETLPNLVLADLRLPDGNFLNYISTNSHEFFLTHPLMIVSSMDDLDVLRSCFASGAHDYLTKPF